MNNSGSNTPKSPPGPLASPKIQKTPSQQFNQPHPVADNSKKAKDLSLSMKRTTSQVSEKVLPSPSKDDHVRSATVPSPSNISTTRRLPVISSAQMPPSEEIEVMLELLMEDLNLTEEKKHVLRILSNERKWTMLQQHLGERYRDSGGGRDVQQEILEIQRLRDNPDKELLTNLVVSLRSRPIRWMSNFIEKGGLTVLLENLKALKDTD
ncbi:hypothetical protein HK096_003049, partial [Nowakowskiella sp. JEL0078]